MPAGQRRSHLGQHRRGRDRRIDRRRVRRGASVRRTRRGRPREGDVVRKAGAVVARVARRGRTRRRRGCVGGRPTRRRAGRAVGARGDGVLRQLQLRLLGGQSLGLFLNAALIVLDPLLIRIDGRGGRRGRGRRARLRRRPGERQNPDHDDGGADEHPLLQVPRDDTGWQLTAIGDASGRRGLVR